MLFMVIEHFRNQDAKAVYRRLREKGRMMPEGCISFRAGSRPISAAVSR
jgi:hypothetical protein